MGKIWKAAVGAGGVLGALITGLELLEALSFLGIRVKLVTVSIWADIIARVVGLVLILTAISFIIIYVFVSLKNLIASFQSRAIEDLNRLQQCAEEMISRTKSPTQTSPQSISDFNVLSKKYTNWIRYQRGGVTLETQVSESANCVAILKAHGYVWGRIKIWRNQRQWKRGIANPKKREKK